MFNTKKILANTKMNKDYSNNKTFYYLMPQIRSVDIDTIDDFNYSKFLLKNAKN